MKNSKVLIAHIVPIFSIVTSAFAAGANDVSAIDTSLIRKFVPGGNSTTWGTLEECRDVLSGYPNAKRQVMYLDAGVLVAESYEKDKPEPVSRSLTVVLKGDPKTKVISVVRRRFGNFDGELLRGERQSEHLDYYEIRMDVDGVKRTTINFDFEEKVSGKRESVSGERRSVIKGGKLQDGSLVPFLFNCGAEDTKKYVAAAEKVADLEKMYADYMLVKDCHDVRKEFKIQYVTSATLESSKNAMKNIEARAKKDILGLDVAKTWSKAEAYYKGSMMGRLVEGNKGYPQNLIPDVQMGCNAAASSLLRRGAGGAPSKDF